MMGMILVRQGHGKHGVPAVAVLAIALIWFAVLQRMGLAAESSQGGVVKVPLTSDTREVTASLRVGSARVGITVLLQWKDGSTTNLHLGTAPATWASRVGVDKTKPEWWKPGNGKVVTDHYPDACIDCPELKVKRYVRTDPAAYRWAEDLRAALIKNWASLPAASQYTFPFSLRLDDGGLQVWIDGRYAGRVDKEVPLTEVTFTASPDAEVKDAQALSNDYPPRFLPLDVTCLAHPGAMQDAVLPMSGRTVVERVPFIVAGGKGAVDVGQARELTQAGLAADSYLARNAFDGTPGSLLLSVPLAQYVRAWVLCAAEENPAKDPVFTMRLTRYAPPGRGDALADTTVWLPKGQEQPDAGIKRVGTTSYTVDGLKKEVALWLVQVPLKVGAIQDLFWGDAALSDWHYLDLDLMGKLRLDTVSRGLRQCKADRDSMSGVHIFGITLERSPVEMQVLQPQVGLIFRGDETPQANVALRPREKGSYTLKWHICDVDAREVSAGARNLQLDPGDKEQMVTVPLAMKENGWYGLLLSLYDSEGKVLMEHPASFALLPPDTRKAGYESPYNVWWFGKQHFGTPDVNIVGPLMHKLGVRRTTMQFDDGKRPYSESDFAPWTITGAQVPWFGKECYLGGRLEEGRTKYEELVRDYVQRFPHCCAALVFHESLADLLPPELYDGAAPPVASAQAPKRWDEATTTAKMLREKFPALKIVCGNSGSSVALAAELFRAKYPKEYIDYLGNEACSQSLMPEMPGQSSPAGSTYNLRAVASKMGYDLPVTACYEWVARTARELGATRCAQWMMRDLLVAHANRFNLMSAGPLLYDVGDCYFNTIYGASGLCQRSPLFYPKPGYVAYATLTRILDQVELTRQVPTGSLTVYALEFKRGNEMVYALWTARGQCATTLRFGEDVKLTEEDMYGRSRAITTGHGEVILNVDTAPQYVIAPMSAKAVNAGRRTYLEDQPLAGMAVVNAMDDADQWQVLSQKDSRLEARERSYQPIRTAGQYLLRNADDPEKGRCLEIELQKVGNVPDIMQEYTLLQLNKPVPLAGRPTTLGVWVKGNSSWGRIMWTFTDAQGRKWISSGNCMPVQCDILDWTGAIHVNFDGWCFLQYPITTDSPVEVVTPGGVPGQWVVGGRAGPVVYPITLTGIAVEMARKALNLTELTDFPPRLRFRDLSAF